jgi:hypothetical protein
MRNKDKSAKLVIKLSRQEVSRQALLEAGFDPLRFGKRQRSTVEVNRKHESKRGYCKHKSQREGTGGIDYGKGPGRTSGPFLFTPGRRAATPRRHLLQAFPQASSR